eukprot:m.39986 g.39986  ORF g.39986 m.39986 type:complete len:165 (-) comp11834_c0_seq1:152-646(-)
MPQTMTGGERLRQLMAAYAVFLVVCGLAGYAWSGFQPKAMSSIFMSAGSALPIAICGWFAPRYPEKASLVAALLTSFLTSIFTWRIYKNITGGGKGYVLVLLGVMAVASLVMATKIKAVRMHIVRSSSSTASDATAAAAAGKVKEEEKEEEEEDGAEGKKAKTS